MMTPIEAVEMLGAVLFWAPHDPAALIGGNAFRARGALRLISFKSGKAKGPHRSRNGRDVNSRLDTAQAAPL
jgi:hypothetical protein